jgi:hypothetical protein
MRRAFVGCLFAGGVMVLLAGHEAALGQRGGVPARPAPRPAPRPPTAAVGVTRGAAVSGPFGSSAAAASTRGTVVGPGGGSVSRGTSTRTVTTPGGTTVRAGGAAVGGTGPGGMSGGRAVGGVQVTGPGGNQMTRVGGAGGISVPGGPTVVNRAGGAAVVGPGGVAAGGSRGTAVIGPGGGVVAGGSRGGVAVGPVPPVVRPVPPVVRPVPPVGRPGTVHWGATTLPAYGTQVRAGFVHRTAFTPAWYQAHPSAWFTAGWVAGRAWAVPQYTTVATFVRLPPQPVYFDYGTNVVYTDRVVYVDGEQVATEEEYYAQAEQLAAAGRAANADAKDEWQPLGVFAMVRGDEETSDKIFQLAVNKGGVIRGTYYDAFTDTTLPVYGQVDRKTQRAAWTVGEKRTVVYEAGCANLTRDETPVLVHFGKDNTQQFVLVHIPQPAGDAPDSKK